MSSNIGMAKFSQRLSTTRAVRGAARLRLRQPDAVSSSPPSRAAILKSPEQMIPDYSRASMAMGYEFSVTALQLAVAYAAIANDGVLVTPDAGARGTRSRPASCSTSTSRSRCAASCRPTVAARLQAYLRSVVEEGGGTGDKARLANYELAGKTGTARRFEGHSYANKGYRASFAAYFPAKDPQLVVVVTIDDPDQGIVLRRLRRGAASPSGCWSRRSRPATSPSIAHGSAGPPRRSRHSCPRPRPGSMPWPR